jgi:hypothetical protein
VQILLENIRRRENAPKEELKSNLLTRIQGKNLWKERHFKKTYPKFVREALQELDALWYVKGS